MRQQAQIQKGQRYAKVSGRPSFRTDWEVRSIFVPAKSAPHAYLINLDDPRDVRIISCLTISDSQYFRLIEQSQQSGQKIQS
jgi:hypothetical protein